MKPKPNPEAWNQLAQAAARAPQEGPELPHGFATRVIAHWKTQTTQASEAVYRTIESFTWRGLAVAMVILIGSAALGYEAVAGFITGDASLTEDLFQIIPGLGQ